MEATHGGGWRPSLLSPRNQFGEALTAPRSARGFGLGDLLPAAVGRQVALVARSRRRGAGSTSPTASFGSGVESSGIPWDWHIFLHENSVSSKQSHGVFGFGLSCGGEGGNWERDPFGGLSHVAARSRRLQVCVCVVGTPKPDFRIDTCLGTTVDGC